jgi:predicted lipoprotein with Yx(FWY)xxD motif
MTTRFDRLRRLLMRPVATAAVTLSLAAVAVTPAIGVSAVSAQGPINCAESVTSTPAGPATVSATSSPYGQVLVIGAGAYTGCSLYTLTSDALHALNGSPYACSDNANPLGAPCDTVLWPALLTDGAPMAGPGVNPTLLGTVMRTDIAGLPAVRQVTYAGLPLYRFLFDEDPGETEGANLFDPITSPTGTWYLVNPSRGRVAPGRARIELETAPLNGTGPVETVLAARMNNDFSVFADASFPVYTSTADRHGAHGGSACQGACAAVYWPPVLTSGWPEAGPGVDPDAVGIIVRPDGTHQVTYQGKPLYLYFGDAYIGGIVGTQGINGAGKSTPFGVFNTIPPTP